MYVIATNKNMISRVSLDCVTVLLLHGLFCCRKIFNTEAKRCFATHDEDNDYFNMRIYIILIACVYIQQFNFIQ